jgi:hypothetical protein
MNRVRDYQALEREYISGTMSLRQPASAPSAAKSDFVNSVAWRIAVGLRRSISCQFRCIALRCWHANTALSSAP